MELCETINSPTDLNYQKGYNQEPLQNAGIKEDTTPTPTNLRQEDILDHDPKANGIFIANSLSKNLNHSSKYSTLTNIHYKTQIPTLQSFLLEWDSSSALLHQIEYIY